MIRFEIGWYATFGWLWWFADTDNARAQADEQIEYITMCAVEDDPDANDVFGYDRVHQVLSAHMWRDLVRVEKPRTTTVPVEAEEPDEVDINDDDDDEDDEEDQAPVASAETNDERELRKFEEALKAMAVHQEKSVQQRKPTSAPAASDDAPIAVEEVGANETFEQRKARLANAERMMAMFLEGVGLTMDDI
jgi:hypothetical protein